MPSTVALIRWTDGRSAPRAPRRQRDRRRDRPHAQRRALLDDQPDVGVVPTERAERRGDQVQGGRPGPADGELTAGPPHGEDRPAADAPGLVFPQWDSALAASLL